MAAKTYLDSAIPFLCRQGGHGQARMAKSLTPEFYPYTHDSDEAEPYPRQSESIECLFSAMMKLGAVATFTPFRSSDLSQSI